MINSVPLSQKHILPQQVDLFFKRHLKLIQKHLKTGKVHVNPISARYDLHFDEKHTLHVEMYAFELGDLNQDKAHHFGQWIYLPEKGFCFIVPVFMIKQKMNYFMFM